MLNIKIVLHILTLCQVLLLVKSNVIKTTTGPVRGKLNHYENTSYYSYEGIPFAEPPIGNLRFMPPVPIKAWKNILNAFKPGPVCPQNGNAYQRSDMDESCLFLNIYVPITTPNVLLPVVFFVHGGYYIVNSGRPEPIYGPQFMLQKGLIVVTTNYRLGALGFLSFRNKQASGNAGMKDIILASKWMKSNIAKFGGHLNQICLLGTGGAGGSLVHYILLTNQTSGIFSSAIMTSGSAISYRAIQNNPIDNALKLARQLGIKCRGNLCLHKLKKIDPFDIVNAESYILSTDPSEAFSLVNYFSPTIEEPSPIAVITEDPLDIIRKYGLVQKIPVMAGFLNQEGLEIFSVLRSNPTAIDELNRSFELCIPTDIQYPCDSEERKQLAESIREFYFDGGNISMFYVQKYINLMTDTAYAYNIDYWINLYKKQKKNSPVYYYFFQFDGQLNWGKLSSGITYPGACRGDELGYIFYTNLTKNVLQNLNYKSQYMLEAMTSLIKNFVIYGNPTPETGECFQWIEAGQNRNHLVLDYELTNVCEPPLQERLGFWYREYDKYYEYKRRNGINTSSVLCLNNTSPKHYGIMAV